MTLKSSILRLIVASCSACTAFQEHPEVRPAQYISAAPEKPWTPKPGQVPAPLSTDPLASLPPALKPTSGRMSLAELVDVALRASPVTRQAWAQAKAAAAQWGAARSSYYPTVAGDITGNLEGAGASRGAADYVEEIGEATLTLNYLLLDFGGRSATAEAARQGLLAANWNQNQAIQDVFLSVANAYYAYLANKSQVEADKASLAEARTSRESAELRLKVGLGTISDVLQARANEAQQSVSLASHQGAAQTSRGVLATAVGWPANADFQVVPELEAPPLNAISKHVDDLIVQAQGNRPELAASIATVQQRKAQLRKAESALLPELSANASGDRQATSGAGLSYNYTVGLEINIPIFEGYLLENNVRAARANLEAAQAELKQTQENVISDTWTSYYDFQTAVQQLKAVKALLNSASESYKVSLASYRAGVADIIDLLTAQSTLASARAEHVQARANFYMSHAALVHAIGSDLPISSNQVPFHFVGTATDQVHD